MTVKKARRARKTALTAEARHWLAEAEVCRQRLQDLAGRTRAGTRGAFRCFYVDPPWMYDNSGAQGSCPYPDMTTEDLEELPLRRLAHADGATLFLWATAPKLDLALHLVAAWGFTYRDTMFWRKVDARGRICVGTGHWVRSCVEVLIIATCGPRPGLDAEARVPQVLVAARANHSAKPEAMRRLLATLQPGVGPGEKIELFARGSGRKGWARWGLDLTGYLMDA